MLKRSWVVPIALVACSGSPADAQPPDAARSAPSAPSEPTLPPQLQLGNRILKSLEDVRVIPTIVLVSDAESYLAALAAWTPTRRFPILIDDGSARSAEDIARFARAFQPESIVTWSSNPDAPPLDGGVSDLADFSVFELGELRGVVARAWGQPAGASDAELIAHWKSLRATPPGVVVVRAGDPAWTAGVALAAARGQPIVQADVAGGVDAIWSRQQADDFCSRLEAATDALTLSWRALGDDIDAVTLACNTPAKVLKAGSESLATTDRVGRLSGGVELPQRWAWAGQVHGDAREANWRAMCALFMTHTKGWLFDGYPDKAPWNTYDCTKAGDAMKQIGMQAEVLDTPKQSAADWRARAVRPVDADLLFVNTKGNADSFDLEPGQCKAADVPILSRPAALHIVHSWSAFVPGNRDLLSGRWMERGVYFYVGSVNEPYLSAFLQTPVVVARMCSGAPWGSAVRIDNGPWWKIAVFGDPLTVFQRGLARAQSAEVPLQNTRGVAERMRTALKEKQLEVALRLMVMRGMDKEAVTIAAVAMRDEPALATPALMELAVLPAFRRQDHDALFDFYAQLDSTRAARPDLRDALWLAASPRLQRPGDKLLGLLRANLRGGTIARDALAVAAAWPSVHQSPSPAELVEQIKRELTDKAQIDALEQAAKQPVSAWGK
jgi:hypothetical protein